MFARDAYHHIAAVERMKERMGLRWTESVEDFDSGEWTMRLSEPVQVTVRSSGLGWEAYSASPEIHCHGRTPSDALGFYRFCLSEYESARASPRRPGVHAPGGHSPISGRPRRPHPGDG